MSKPDDDYRRIRKGGREAQPDAESNDEGAGGWPGKRSGTSGLTAPPGVIARKAAGDSEVPEAHRELLASAASSPGGPLPDYMRGRLESSLKSDLSSVRVHTGGASAEAASSVGALAYTTGQDIHFGSGAYDPGSSAGEALIAHEVAHTVQQRGSSADVRQDKLEVSSPGDAHEVEADSFAQSFVAGTAAAVTPVSAGTISRVVISRQQVPHPGPGPIPPAPDPAAPPAAAPAPTITFQPTFEVRPGALAPGVARTQQVVYRGDTLVFRATVANVTPAETEFGVVGTVVGASSGTTHVLTGNDLTITTTVASMGKVQQQTLGQAPDLVEAKPFAKLNRDPFTWIGDRRFQFRVLADMAWLISRCDTAGSDGRSAYHDTAGRLATAFAPFKAAYRAQKATIDAYNAAQRLQEQQLKDIFMVAAMGATGGGLSAFIQLRPGLAAAGKVGQAMVGTASGDLSKYIGRLGGPTSVGLPAPLASFEPDTWVEAVRAKIEEEAGKTERAGNDLRRAMQDAWAAGRTIDLSLDPVELVAPHVAELQGAFATVETQMVYAQRMWTAWLESYAFTVYTDVYGPRARQNIGSQPANWINSNPVFTAALEQCGSSFRGTLEAAIQTSRGIAEAEARRLQAAMPGMNPNSGAAGYGTGQPLNPNSGAAGYGTGPPTNWPNQ